VPRYVPFPPYGIKDHGTSLMGHFAHVRLRDHNHVSGKGAGGNPGQIEKLAAGAVITLRTDTAACD
jgi:hypothetical protein